jgi:pyruvate formate-lyase/glycerol dehydratase family glycyl radical enzyme
MSVADAVSGTPISFEDIRQHLCHQYEQVPYDTTDALSSAELEATLERYLAANPAHPRVIQAAHAFELLLTRGQICIDPLDWFADKLNHGSLLWKLKRRWMSQVEKELGEEGTWHEWAVRLGVVRAGIDTGHIAPGFTKVLSRGLLGLTDEAHRCRAELGERATPEQLAFYEAVEITNRAAITIADRFATLAERMAAADEVHAPRLRQMAEVCRRVPAYPARTFHEALQCCWFLHEWIEMDGEAVRSMGHVDRMLYSYYQADMETGRLTREQAKDLLKALWVKNFARTKGGNITGKNFLFGGQDAQGHPIANDLTYLALEAYEELNVPDPKLSVRFCPGSPDLLYQRVADMIRRNKGSFVLMNDGPAVEALVKQGKTREDARVYLPIGCYEPAVEGKEAGCTMNLIVNLAKGVELALNDGKDPRTGEQVGPTTGDPRSFASFDEVVDAYTRQMNFVLRRATDNIKAHERAWPWMNPSAFIAGTIDDCLQRGRDIGQAGAHYNAVGCVGVALGSTVDSLLAIRHAVFDEKRYTMDEVLSAMAADFQGQERLRQYLLNRAPKWGTGDAQADVLARSIADYYCSTIHSLSPNGRGGPFQASLFAFAFQWSFGKLTGALPDGRRAWTPLSPGVGPSPGRDKEGVTALIDSVCKLDFTATPNGSVLDIALHPSAVAGEAGLAALVTLIKTFFARGGYGLQFNVLDMAALREAQMHPEDYASLQVRVTGYSAYFTKLPRYEQDQFLGYRTHGE